MLSTRNISPPPLAIASFGRYTFLMTLHSSSSTIALTANRAYAIPCVVEHPLIVTHVCIANGGTLAGNFDIGLYRENKTKVFSIGSTAQSGGTINAPRLVTVSPNVEVGAGSYYMVFAAGSATARYYLMTNTGDNAGASATTASVNGCGYQDSAFPLPATLTLLNYIDTVIPYFSMQTKIH